MALMWTSSLASAAKWTCRSSLMGLITLLLGVIVVFAGIGRVLAFPDDATPLFVVGFFAAIADLLITGYDWWYLWDTSNVDSAFIDIDLIGWGLELAVVGSITAIIVAVVEAYR